jgi:hypothetical protein
MTELISKDIVDLQDIEKVQFVQALQADPAKYAAYVADKSNRILSEVVDTKRASFVKVSGDMARQMDMDHNSRAALMRTEDLANSQTQIVGQQQAEIDSMKYTIDTTRRQTEINNWYYEDKRETLFVLQLILLVMLFVAIVLMVVAKGWLSEQAGDYVMGFAILIGAGVWLYRWYYTQNIRDPRYWNRRQFPQDGKVAPPSAEICIGGDGNTQPVKPAQ